MSAPISDLTILLRSMEPILNTGVFCFVSVPLHTAISTIEHNSMIREKEVITLVIEESMAERLNLRVLFRSSWITLNVHSDLNAVGLTAAFATQLGIDGISCNVIAGAFHDHIFVPVESAERAIASLQMLQRR
jgi:hypothetical protein